MIARPGFWFPTREQLKKTYTSIVEGKAKAGQLLKLRRAPAGTKDVTPFKNVGIDGMKGRENIYDVRGELILENVKDGKSTWSDAGPAPLF
ncbi:MAG: hypothetical protein IPJ65_10120 [Archangiaceae bacterium]|nr:hypothetical protein [Archangiaceae bacterium]